MPTPRFVGPATVSRNELIVPSRKGRPATRAVDLAVATEFSTGKNCPEAIDVVLKSLYAATNVRTAGGVNAPGERIVEALDQDFAGREFDRAG